MKKIILYFLLFCVVPSFGYAQTLQWTSYNSSNSGLLSDDVRALAFETNGTAWIGHGSGVNKFDGSTWVFYTTFNSPLPNDVVNTICIDNVNNKWFGTDGGLARFDGTNWTVYTMANSDLPDDVVKALASDAAGNIWVGTDNGGITKFNGSTWTVYNTANSGFVTNSFSGISIAPDGHVWAVGAGGIHEFDGSSWTLYNTSNTTLPTNVFLSVTADNAGNKWFGSFGEGLFKYDGSSFTHYHALNSGLSSNDVSALLADAANTLWVGTYDKLNSFDGTTWSAYAAGSGLPNNLILSLGRQSGTKLWVGTGFGAASFCYAITPVVSASSTQLCGAGQSASLSTASVAGLTYQWRLNGNPIAGATTNTHVTSSAGNYAVTTTNTGGCAANSTATTITVNAPVSFLVQPPANVLGCPGSSAQISCLATGCGLIYRWQQLVAGTWVNLNPNATFSGTATSTLTISNLNAALNGQQFRCRITGTFAPTLAFSSAATLTVNTTPAISLSNLPSPVCAPTTVNLLSVVVTDANNSTGTLSYRNSDLSPVNNPSTLAVSGIYYIIKSTACSASDTASVNVTINPVPDLITSDPAPICKPGVLSLLDHPVTDNNSTNGSFTYWTDAALTTPVANPDSITTSTQFYILKSTDASCYDTIGVYFTIGTKVVVQPKNQEVCRNDGIAVFSLYARGVNLSYQWQQSDSLGLSWANLTESSSFEGVATDSLTIKVNGNSSLHKNKYRCRIATTCSNPIVNSIPKTLSLKNAPLITSEPIDKIVCSSTQTYFRVHATGDNMSYRWQRKTPITPWTNLGNTNNFDGANTDSLIINSAKAGFNTHQFRCVVTNECGRDTSLISTLYVNNSILSQSLNANACTSDTAHFNVTAQGVNPVYTWQQQIGNGAFTTVVASSMFSGVNTPVLSIANPTLSMHNYKYRCRVTGSCGPAAFSDAKELHVWDNMGPIIITLNPSNTEVCEGSTAMFISQATANVDFRYQWQYYNTNQAKWLNIQNDATYSGAKNDTLWVEATSGLNTLAYRCAAIANCPPLAVSSQAVLTVNSCGAFKSASDFASSTDVQAFPNPADQVLNFTLPYTALENMTLSILDCTGRIMETIKIPTGATQITLPVHHYANGSYIAEIKESGQQSIRLHIAVGHR